jgi:glutamine amidotransferase
LPLSSEIQKTFKIPHVGWNKLLCPQAGGALSNHWHETILEDIHPGDFMYFVHSNAVIPTDRKYILAETEYGGCHFCSVVRKDNISGCQFHPEMSGEHGLDIYRQFVSDILNHKKVTL